MKERVFNLICAAAQWLQTVFGWEYIAGLVCQPKCQNLSLFLLSQETTTLQFPFRLDKNSKMLTLDNPAPRFSREKSLKRFIDHQNRCRLIFFYLGSLKPWWRFLTISKTKLLVAGIYKWQIIKTLAEQVIQQVWQEYNVPAWTLVT